MRVVRNPFAKKHPSTGPIQNLQSVDILGKRHDGGIDLVIVASSHLDGSASTQKLLLEKLDSYFAYLTSAEFACEFGPPEQKRVTVIVRSYDQPDPVIVELLKSCRPWASEHHATLQLELGKG